MDIGQGHPSSMFPPQQFPKNTYFISTFQILDYKM